MNFRKKNMTFCLIILMFSCCSSQEQKMDNCLPILINEIKTTDNIFQLTSDENIVILISLYNWDTDEVLKGAPIYKEDVGEYLDIINYREMDPKSYMIRDKLTIVFFSNELKIGKPYDKVIELGIDFTPDTLVWKDKRYPPPPRNVIVEPPVYILKKEGKECRLIERSSAIPLID